METIRKIRCAHERDKKSIRQIAIDFRLARNTVKKILRSGITDQQNRTMAQNFRSGQGVVHEHLAKPFATNTEAVQFVL